MKRLSTARRALVALIIASTAAVTTIGSATATSRSSVISTLVGSSCSPGTSATVAVNPQAVLADGQGGLYVADYVHSVVCHVAASGVVTRVAGNGTMGYLQDGVAANTTELYTPTGLALDASGNLYIADRWNQRVRMVDASSGIISTVAGTGAAGFNGDGGQATSAWLNFPTAVYVEGSNLYIADSHNNRVRVVDLSTGVIGTFAGTGSAGGGGDYGRAVEAQLNQPTGITRDPWGNTYIADSNNNRVRRVDVYGTMYSSAGTGAPGFAGDGGRATGASLRTPLSVSFVGAALYIADSGNQRVRKVDLAGVITSVAGNGAASFSGDGGNAVAAALNFPMGVTVDGTGTLYIADTNNDRVRRVDPSTGVITTAVGNGTGGYSGDGGPAAQAEAYEPMSVDVGPDGAVYFADTNNDVVRKIVNGVVTAVAGTGGVAGFGGDGGPATSARLNFPTGVAVDRYGNVFIADRGNNRIRKVTASSGKISTIAGTGVQGYGGDGSNPLTARLDLPADVAVDSAGTVYVADAGNNRIRRIAGNRITSVAGNGTKGFAGDNGLATAAALNNPTGVAIDGSGVLYIADRDNQRVRRFKVGSRIITVAGSGVLGFSGDGTRAVASALNFPTGIALDRSGNLIIADTGNCVVRQVTAPGSSSATITTIVGWNPAGGIYPVCGYAGDGGGPTTGGTRLYNPITAAVDAQGNLYIADSLTSTIRKVTA